MLPAFDSLAEAYLHGLQQLITSGDPAPPVLDALSPASRFGAEPRAAIEKLGDGFRLKTSQPSILLIGNNKLNVQYLLGQFLWFISGSGDLDYLTYYNPRARDFSHDGSSLCGSFGLRVFGRDTSENQIVSVIDLLRRDPGSRRAYVSVIGRDDLLHPTKETPCNAGIQFFIRNSALHAVCTMRAQQALRLLPYDAFLFMGLQSILASELALKVGEYVHFSNTFHIYGSERETVRQIAEGGVSQITLPHWHGGLRAVKAIADYEQNLRQAALRQDNGAIGDLSPPLSTGVTDAGDLAEVLMHAAWVTACRKTGQTQIRSTQLLRNFGLDEHL
jgi:thymidylate synthase